MKLYSYFRSSASYRVRIALNLKGLSCEVVPVHLLRDGGEQLRADYRRLNPDALVPSLQLDEGTVLTQSLAILEYLDEHDLGELGELMDSAETSVRAHYALFGLALVESEGEETSIFDASEPMMTRGS